MLECLRKEKYSKDLETLVSDGERNLERISNQLLINGRYKLDVEWERKKWEDRVREISDLVRKLENKIEEQEAEVVRLRQDEERFDQEYNAKMNEVDR